MFWNHHYVNKTKYLENLFVFGRRMALVQRSMGTLPAAIPPHLYTCFDTHNLTFIAISRSLVCASQGKEIPEDKVSSKSQGMKTYAHILCSHDIAGIPWVLLTFLRAKGSKYSIISYNIHSKTVIFFLYILHEK